MTLIKLLSEHAREKAAMPPDWECFRWQCMPPAHPETLYYEVEGAVAPLKQRGPGKGNRNWRKLDKATLRTIIITAAEHDDWLKDWQERTGGCIPCGGEGTRLRCWSAKSGAEYDPCPTCGGTGKAAVQEGEAA